MRTGEAKTAGPGWRRRRAQRLPRPAETTTAAEGANGSRIKSGMTAEGEAGAGVSVAERRDDGREGAEQEQPVLPGAAPPLSPVGDISPSRGERDASGDARAPATPGAVGARPSPHAQAVTPGKAKPRPGAYWFPERRRWDRGARLPVRPAAGGSRVPNRWRRGLRLPRPVETTTAAEVANGSRLCADAWPG